MQDLSQVSADKIALQNRLFSLIKKGLQFDVIKAINDGADPKLPCEPGGPTPLEYCILEDQFECFKTIYAKGADITILIGEFKMSVLHFAALHGRFNIVWYLTLPEKKLMLKETDLRGYRPVHYAATHNMKLYNLLAEKNAHRYAKTNQGELPIHAAASFGNTQMVREFIELGNLAYERDNFDNTPMHCAAAGGHLDTVNFLRTQKGSKNYWNKQGETPFLSAVKKGRVAVARSLALPEKDYNVRALRGVSAMHLAAKADSVAMVKFLQVEGQLGLFITDEEGRQPAHFAAQFNAINVFCYILDQLASSELTADQSLPPNEQGSTIPPQLSLIDRLLAIKDNQDQTVVAYAAKGRARIILSRLVDLGVNLNVADALGCTAMHYLANDGNVELMKILKSLGLSYTQADNRGNRPCDSAVLKAKFKMNPNAANKMNPLHTACAAGDVGTIDLLMAMGIYDLYDVDEKGYNGLHHAAQNNCDKVIALLILTYNMDSKRQCNSGLLAVHHAALKSSLAALEALVDIADSYEELGKLGEQPIHVACMSGAMEGFRFLVAKKVNVYAVTNRKQNCVFYAALSSNIELLTVLCDEFKFDLVNLLDENNSTPLHLALNACTLKTVQFLCGKGVSLTAINNKGLTAENIAKEKLAKAEVDKNEKAIDRLRPIVTYLERQAGQKHVFFRGTASIEEVMAIPRRSEEEKAGARAKRQAMEEVINVDEAPKSAKY